MKKKNLKAFENAKIENKSLKKIKGGIEAKKVVKFKAGSDLAGSVQ